MTRNEMIVWLIEKSKAPSSSMEESAETASPGEEDNNDSEQRADSSLIEKPGGKKAQIIPQAPISQDSSGPESDHRMSDFSDISSTQSQSRESQEN